MLIFQIKKVLNVPVNFNAYLRIPRLNRSSWIVSTHIYLLQNVVSLRRFLPVILPNQLDFYDDFDDSLSNVHWTRHLKKRPKQPNVSYDFLFGMHAGVSSGFHLRFLVMVFPIDTKVY